MPAAISTLVPARGETLLWGSIGGWRVSVWIMYFPGQGYDLSAVAENAEGEVDAPTAIREACNALSDSDCRTKRDVVRALEASGFVPESPHA